MNQKTHKIVRNFVAFLLLIAVLTFFSIRFWLGYRFPNVIKGLPYKDFSQEIKRSKALPDKVYVAFAKVHHYNQNMTTNKLILKMPLRFFGMDIKSADCPCVEVNYPLVKNFWDRLTVGLQLDKVVGSKKCLDYYLEKFDFGFNQIGVRQAARFYYHQTLETLKEDELLELCLMTKNPSVYNKKVNPNRLKNEILKMKL